MKKIFLALCIMLNISVAKEIRIAEQYGTIYAPIYGALELGLFKEQGLEIKKQKFGGGAAIAEALIGGHLDAGCVGIPPALIAMDKGAGFKIAFGINIPAIELVTFDKNIASLDDIKANDKIGLNGGISIQQMMLSMAAIKSGNPKKFDNNLAIMPQPEAFIALKQNTIKAHFASQPFLLTEIKEGGKVLLRADDIGLKASIVCVVSKDFYNSTDYKGFKKAVEKSIELINNKDEKMLEVISKTEKQETTTIKEILDYPGTIYTTKVYGVKTLADHMLESGYIKKNKDTKEYFWDSNIIGE